MFVVSCHPQAQVGQAHVRCLNVRYFPYILIHSNRGYLVLNSGTTVFIVPISIKICRVTLGYPLVVNQSIMCLKPITCFIKNANQLPGA